jgi:hypothetical protein
LPIFRRDPKIEGNSFGHRLSYTINTLFWYVLFVSCQARKLAVLHGSFRKGFRYRGSAQA